MSCLGAVSRRTETVRFPARIGKASISSSFPQHCTPQTEQLHRLKALNREWSYPAFGSPGREGTRDHCQPRGRSHQAWALWESASTRKRSAPQTLPPTPPSSPGTGAQTTLIHHHRTARDQAEEHRPLLIRRVAMADWSETQNGAPSPSSVSVSYAPKLSPTRSLTLAGPEILDVLSV